MQDFSKIIVDTEKWFKQKLYGSKEDTRRHWFDFGSPRSGQGHIDCFLME